MSAPSAGPCRAGGRARPLRSRQRRPAVDRTSVLPHPAVLGDLLEPDTPPAAGARTRRAGRHAREPGRRRDPSVAGSQVSRRLGERDRVPDEAAAIWASLNVEVAFASATTFAHASPPAAGAPAPRGRRARCRRSAPPRRPARSRPRRPSFAGSGAERARHANGLARRCSEPGRRRGPAVAAPATHDDLARGARRRRVRTLLRFRRAAARSAARYASGSDVLIRRTCVRSRPTGRGAASRRSRRLVPAPGAARSPGSGRAPPRTGWRRRR